MPFERSSLGLQQSGSAAAFSVSGFLLLLPGVPQWLSRQRERGLVLIATYASTLGIGLFAWGTRMGLALVLLAYITHVISASDAIRQCAFPGFGRSLPMVSTSAGLAAFYYGPLLVVGTLVAWPAFEEGDSGGSYVVDRLAYKQRSPAPGEHVWLGPSENSPGDRLGQILAGPGDDVEWAGGHLRVGARRLGLMPFRPGESPRHLAFKVPNDQYLIAFRTNDPVVADGWELMPSPRIEGQAWAKLYPVWERRLLP